MKLGIVKDPRDVSRDTSINLLDPEAAKETLRAASDEEIARLARVLTQDQYVYATLTLPPKKVAILRNARMAAS